MRSTSSAKPATKAATATNTADTRHRPSSAGRDQQVGGPASNEQAQAPLATRSSWATAAAGAARSARRHRHRTLAAEHPGTVPRARARRHGHALRATRQARWIQRIPCVRSSLPVPGRRRGSRPPVGPSPTSWFRPGVPGALGVPGISPSVPRLPRPVRTPDRTAGLIRGKRSKGLKGSKDPKGSCRGGDEARWYPRRPGRGNGGRVCRAGCLPCPGSSRPASWSPVPLRGAASPPRLAGGFRSAPPSLPEPISRREPLSRPGNSSSGAAVPSQGIRCSVRCWRSRCWPGRSSCPGASWRGQAVCRVCRRSRLRSGVRRGTCLARQGCG